MWAAMGQGFRPEALPARLLTHHAWKYTYRLQTVAVPRMKAHLAGVTCCFCGLRVSWSDKAFPFGFSLVGLFLLAVG